jgi:hypothetical protein
MTMTMDDDVGMRRRATSRGSDTARMEPTTSTMTTWVTIATTNDDGYDDDKYDEE